MKGEMFAAAIALVVMACGQAVAQWAEAEIDPESRARIKEYVVREKVAPVRVRERVDVDTIFPRMLCSARYPPIGVRGARATGTSIPPTVRSIWSSRPRAGLSALSIMRNRTY